MTIIASEEKKDYGMEPGAREKWCIRLLQRKGRLGKG